MLLKGGESMAVIVNKLSSSLVIKAKTGVTEAGKDKLMNVAIRNIKTDAIDSDLFEIAEVITLLLKYPVQGILREEVNELVSEA